MVDRGSGGGGLALAFALELRHQNLPQPERLILLSPWLDVGLSNPRIAEFDAIDPMLSATELRKVGRLWAGLAGGTGWQASPLQGEIKQLAAIELFTSTGDLLNPDAHVLQQKAADSGQELRLWETPELLHDWVLLDLPESAGPKRQILAWLSKLK